MTAAKPHVVFQQILRADEKKVLANFAAATSQQVQEYIAYIGNLPQTGAGGVLEAAVLTGTPRILDVLLEHGARPKGYSRDVWNAWANRASREFETPNFPLNSKEPARVEGIFEVLVKHRVGVDDLIGKHWGPAHKMISAYRDAPDRALACLEKMKAAGYGFNDRDEIGETPLAIAAWTLSTRVMEWLLKEGVDLDARTTGGKSIGSFVLRNWSGSRDIQKIERMSDVQSALQILDGAGYDFKADLENKEELAKLWGARNGDVFETAWGVLKSFVESKEIAANTAPALSSIRGMRL